MISFLSFVTLTAADFASNGTSLSTGTLGSAGSPPNPVGLLETCQCGGGSLSYFSGETYANFNGYGCIGGCGGGGWEFHAEGQLLTKLEMWYGGGASYEGADQICMILSNGEHKCVGQATESSTYCHYEFDVQGGEKLWTMALHGNGHGTRLGRIEFKTITSDGETHDFSCGHSHTAYPANNVDGMMISGFFGQSGSDVDQLGVLLSSPQCKVTKREITKIECVNKSGGNCKADWMDGGKYASVDQICNACKTSQRSSCAFDFSLKEDHTITTTSTSIDSLGTDISIGAEFSESFFGLVGMKETVQVTVKYSHSWQRSKSMTTTTSTNIGSNCAIQLDGGHAVKAYGNVHAGDMKADMKFTVTTTTSCGQREDTVHDATVVLSDVAVVAEVASCTFEDVDCNATPAPTPDATASWSEVANTNIPGSADLVFCSAYPQQDIRTDPTKIAVCKQECVDNSACVAIVVHPWGTMLKSADSPTETRSGFSTYFLTRSSSLLSGSMLGAESNNLMAGETEDHARRYSMEDQCLHNGDLFGSSTGSGSGADDTTDNNGKSTLFDRLSNRGSGRKNRAGGKGKRFGKKGFFGRL